MHMIGSRMRTLAAVPLMLSVLSGCNISVSSGTAIDRIQPDAATHARALAGDDVAYMRETGLTLLARLGAYAGWSE